MKMPIAGILSLFFGLAALGGASTSTAMDTTVQNLSDQVQRGCRMHPFRGTRFGTFSLLLLKFLTGYSKFMSKVLFKGGLFLYVPLFAGHPVCVEQLLPCNILRIVFFRYSRTSLSAHSAQQRGILGLPASHFSETLFSIPARKPTKLLVALNALSLALYSQCTHHSHVVCCTRRAPTCRHGADRSAGAAVADRR